MRLFRVKFAYGYKGFTLAELLSALAILGVIATFTIPKVLNASQSSQWKSGYKEFASMISGAYAAYTLENTPTTATDVGDLTPYMNYVRIDTSSTVDQAYGSAGTVVCGASNTTCLQLHSGAMAFLALNKCFRGTTDLHAIGFGYDPDGKVTAGGLANDPGKQLSVTLYFNGRITSRDAVMANTLNGNNNCTGSNTINPDPTIKPEWFEW